MNEITSNIENLVNNFGKLSARKELIKLLKDSTTSYSCKNQNGEDVDISISDCGIITKIYQSNGALRIDEYDNSGYFISQSFNGRWK